MRITDGGKNRRRGGEQRTGTVSRHGDAHYLCPQCRDINPLHLNARTRSASSLSARGNAGVGRAPREEEEEMLGSSRARESRSCSRGSCSRGHLSRNSSRTSGARAARRLPRSRGRARILHRRFLLTVNKLESARSPRDRNNFAIPSAPMVRDECHDSRTGVSSSRGKTNGDFEK